MTRNEKIRLEYTFLLQRLQESRALFSMIDLSADALWGEIKIGQISTERTFELMRWTKELTTKTISMTQEIAAIEEEIKRGAISEKQVRMEFKE